MPSVGIMSTLGVRGVGCCGDGVRIIGVHVVCDVAGMSGGGDDSVAVGNRWCVLLV